MPFWELDAGVRRMTRTVLSPTANALRPHRWCVLARVVTSARVAAIAGLLTCAPLVLAGQSGRIVGTTWAQFIDLRPLRIDSIPVSSTILTTAGDRTTADGQPVQCSGTAAYCRILVSDRRAMASPIMQDLEFSGWGLGEGISAHAHLRARETLGADALPWPRANDRFDALDAYVNIERDQLRFRIGRQWTGGALGLYNFDGAAVAWQTGTWRVEGIGGSSLVTGLNATHLSGDLAELDDLPPDERAWLMGARVRFRPSLRSSVAAEYQRTLRSDRAALYSERASLAASTTWAGVALDGEWTQDLLTNTINEGRLRAERALPKGLRGTLEGRRSRPFFELWSIWGAFSPVGFDEARATLRRGFGARWTTSVGGGYRRYDETHAGLAAAPLREDGWRGTATALFTPNDRVTIAGDYAIDVGPGASRSDGSLGAEWSGERLSWGGTLSAVQSIFEYRLGTGRIYGAGLHGSYRISTETRVAADAAWYGHRMSGAALGTNWGQRRASVRLEWAVGRDPGVSRAMVKP